MLTGWNIPADVDCTGPSQHLCYMCTPGDTTSVLMSSCSLQISIQFLSDNYRENAQFFLNEIITLYSRSFVFRRPPPHIGLKIIKRNQSWHSSSLASSIGRWQYECFDEGDAGEEYVVDDDDGDMKDKVWSLLVFHTLDIREIWGYWPPTMFIAAVHTMLMMKLMIRMSLLLMTIFTRKVLVTSQKSEICSDYKT